MIHFKRVDAVLEKMKERQIKQLLICDPLSIYYLTGSYTNPGERFYALYLHISGKSLIFLNELFYVPDELGIEKVWYNDTQPVMDIVALHLDAHEVLGVDKNLPARFLLPLVDKKAAAGFVLASSCVDDCRGCKDVEEQGRMRTASHINDLAMAEFKKLITLGVTEMQLAEQMCRIYRSLGADDFSFEPIVAFGENAADTHHMPGSTVLKDGDCVLIDTGCRKDTYCSDMTRTFFYKSATTEHCNIYETVRQANEAAIAAIKPGVKLSQIDKTARDIISNAGYGPHFTHRLGHFIGLDVHEFGDVSSNSDIVATPGMIFSIEPGVYLMGDVGIRIEDLVLVTEDGCTSLNTYSKELEILD